MSYAVNFTEYCADLVDNYDFEKLDAYIKTPELWKDSEEEDSEEGNSEEEDSEEGDSEEGDSEEGNSKEGDSEEGDSEEGDSEEGDSEEGDSEEGDSEEEDSKKEDSEENNSEEGNSVEKDSEKGDSEEEKNNNETTEADNEKLGLYQVMIYAIYTANLIVLDHYMYETDYNYAPEYSFNLVSFALLLYLKYADEPPGNNVSQFEKQEYRNNLKRQKYYKIDKHKAYEVVMCICEVAAQKNNGILVLNEAAQADLHKHASESFVENLQQRYSLNLKPFVSYS